jgi:hypothetical protein
LSPAPAGLDTHSRRGWLSFLPMAGATPSPPAAGHLLSTRTQEVGILPGKAQLPLEGGGHTGPHPELRFLFKEGL